MAKSDEEIVMKPIGIVLTDAKEVPPHWSVSDVKGTLIIDQKYAKGLKDIKAGQRIVVTYYAQESPEFSDQYLSQTSPYFKEPLGVFSICSPIRPNPICMSVVDVLHAEDIEIFVEGLDILNGSPILDIKPYVC